MNVENAESKCRCTYCHFPVAPGQRVAECSACGATLREAGPKAYEAMAEFSGERLVWELEQRTRRLQERLAQARPGRVQAVGLVGMALLIVELLLVQAGMFASRAGQETLLIAIVAAGAAVAVGAYGLLRRAFSSERRHKGFEQGLAVLSGRLNRARRAQLGNAAL